MNAAAALFDLDGTLLNTLEDIADAVNRALGSLGFPEHPVDAYRYFVGEGIAELARRALPLECRGTDDLRECLAAVSREYGGGLLVKTKPYDGVPELLAELAGRGIRCAVVSNKPHELTLRSVGALLAGVPFGAVLGERKGVPPKPDPAIAVEAASILGVSPARCVYVGDSGIDMKTATAAGMYPVGVLWGFRDEKELADNGAKSLVKHPLDLIKLVDERFGAGSRAPGWPSIEKKPFPAR
jgi:phosphoglycolate phosphatase